VADLFDVGVGFLCHLDRIPERQRIYSGRTFRYFLPLLRLHGGRTTCYFRGKNNMALFVWLQGIKGPTNQIWWLGKMTKDQKPLPTLQEHQMTEEDEQLSMKQLAEKYPLAKKKTPDAPVQ
jgi:hypothetical protein